MRCSARFVLVMCAGVALSTPLAAYAGDPVSPSSEPLGKEEAIKAFTKGRDLILAGKQAEALPVLTRSFQLLPSPNTELLIAHAEKGLNRRARAADHYEHVVTSAEAEIAKGNTKYEETLAEAKRALAELSPLLGTIEITADATLRFTVTSSAGDVDTFTGSARVWAEPGGAKVKPDDTPEYFVEVIAGLTQKVHLRSLQPPPPERLPMDPPEAAPSRSIGPVGIAGIVIGGVGLVGVGVFAGLGSSAQSTYDELVACGCSVTEAATLREDGKQAQLIANVSLGVGLGLAAGGVTMLIVDFVVPKKSDEAPPTARVLPLVAIDHSGGYAGVSVLLP